MAFRTQGDVERLRMPAGKREHWVFDHLCRGLSVRLQGEAKTWMVWYQVNGRRRKVKIGDVVGLKLDQARRQATAIVNGAKDGQDALGEREAAKARAAHTLGALIGMYLEKRAKPRQRPRTYAETQRYLLKRWAPLHDRPLDGITRRDVAARIERIRVEHGPIAAKHARVYLSGCYAWALKQGLADQNPLIGTEAPDAGPGRDRVLKPEELAEVWRACDDPSEHSAIVRLLMLLGQRRDEVASMAWSELDLDRALWVIPASRAKNNRAHEVPLPRQALALLPERREGRDLLFGRGRAGFSGFSNSKARLDERILENRGKADPNAKPLPGWRLHDLRHSFVTQAAEIGIEPHILEAVVNHVSGHKAGIAGRYNHATYRDQKRAALERYADWLGAVVSGG